MAGGRKSNCTEDQIKELLLQGLPKYKVRKQLHTSYEAIAAVAAGLDGVYETRKRSEAKLLAAKAEAFNPLREEWESVTRTLRRMGFRKARPDEQVEWITRVDVIRRLRHE